MIFVICFKGDIWAHLEVNNHVTNYCYLGPVANRGRTQCASSCRATDKFQYEPGKTYTYDYETQVTSKIHEDAIEHAKLRMTATAEFSVLAPCEIVLKVINHAFIFVFKAQKFGGLFGYNVRLMITIIVHPCYLHVIKVLLWSLTRFIYAEWKMLLIKGPFSPSKMYYTYSWHE